MSASDGPEGALLIKDDGVFAFQHPALLQRYEIQGLPPRLHATSNTLLDPPPSVTPIVTDGVDLFGVQLLYDGQGQRGVRAQFWNASNALISDVTLPLSASLGYASFAAFQGLAIVRLDALSILDTTGAIVWTLPVSALQASLLGAYGCGFIAEGGDYKAGVLTTIPLDGRPTLTQTSPPEISSYNGGPFAWPYDPHGVLFVTQPIPTDPNFDASAGCTTSIDVLFDDGRAPIHHEHHTMCGVSLGALPSSLGAVVFVGDQVALLDANADMLGGWLSTQGASLVPIGNYLVALGSVWSSETSSYSYAETVIGCGP